jgi:polar amino acid transport system substrate-binding protein
MKIIIRILIGLILFLSGCGEESTNNNIFRIGVSTDYPPFEFKKNGKLVGFDIELAKLIAKELGREVEFYEMEFNAIFASLNNNHVDAGISAITITEKRKKNFDFSDIYHFSSLAAIYNKDHPINNKDDLMDKKVACQLGTTMEIWLKSNVSSAEITTFDNNNQAIESLKSGYSQVVITDIDQAKSFSENNSKLAYQIIAEADDGFVVALKKNSNLAKEVNNALKKLVANGEIKSLQAKWLSK